MTSKAKNTKNSNSPTKKTVVAGCGNYGRTLAMNLAESGQEVIIIEKDRSKLEALSRLSGQNDLIIGFLGDATINDDLLEIDVGNADSFVATTGSDAINALAAQKVKVIFGVDEVICLMSDTSRQRLYENLGIKIVNHTEITIKSLIDSSLES